MRVITCCTEMGSAQGSLTLGPSLPVSLMEVLLLAELPILEDVVQMILDLGSFFLADMVEGVGLVHRPSSPHASLLSLPLPRCFPKVLTQGRPAAGAGRLQPGPLLIP